MNVIESIYSEPEKWTQTNCTLVHSSGAQVWTVNLPILDTNMYPPTCMSLISKFKLWKAVKWWANNAPIEAFGRG